MAETINQTSFLDNLRSALAAHERGERGVAQLYARDASACMPDNARSAFLLAGVYERCEAWQDAEHYYTASLKHDPTDVRVWHRLGLVRLACNTLEGALIALRYACVLAPDNGHYAVDYSMALARSGQFDAVLEAANHALSVNADDVVALNNLGHALQNLNQSREALAYYERALSLAPEQATIRFGHATALLKSGDFQRGWAEYEWRWKDCQTVRTDLTMPVWEGEALAGKTILVHHEQGYGDTVQFVRLLPYLARQGARVIVQVPQPLVRLVEQVEGVHAVCAVLDPSVFIDVHCPLLSLPARMSYDPRDEKHQAYLRLRQGDQPAWRKGGSRPFTVGLVWAGDPRPHDPKANQTDARRSVALDVLALLLALPSVRFVSFQMGPARAQRLKYQDIISDGTEDIIDFYDTARRLSDIDLLITVDTAISHVMGGLGRPVWLLSRHDACWRWGDQGVETAWYPSMRIFRQAEPGQWAQPVRDMVHELSVMACLEAL